MRLQIEVTAYHISEGRSGEYNACPIALSLWDAGYRGINVDEKFVKVTWGRRKLEFLPPKEMKVFIDDFDNLRPVKPSKFELTQVLPIANISSPTTSQPQHPS